MPRPVLVLLSLLAVFSCGKDRVVPRTCPETQYRTTEKTSTTTSTTTSTQSGFDIEHVSVLEATDQLRGGADAVILDRQGTLPANSTWRVSSVDVLVMIRDRDYPNYPYSVGENTVSLTVQVWDADNPTTPSKPAYEVRQQLTLSALTWERVTINSGTFRKAWWTFPFVTPTQDIIPRTGMTAPRYLVGVKWDQSNEPQIGYSNFDRPCQLNWTNTSGSQWILNSTLGSVNQCNWPMLRVNTEVLTTVTTTTTVPVTEPITVMVERDVCDPNAVEVTTVLDGGVDAGTR